MEPSDPGTDCAFCRGEGGLPVARTPLLRVVQVEDPDYPGYLRVIWNAHVTEMSDLTEADRVRLLAAVNAVEASLREVLAPDKINLASLGNQVPHLHWHVIARFVDDAHFPQPIWAARLRESDAARLSLARANLATVADLIRRLIPPD